MSYAQTNYQQKMGSGQYTIAEIGCFLTAFCNLLTDRFGTPVDPPSLDDFFTRYNKFIFDGADHAYEDLGWSSVSQYSSRVAITNTGAGWPSDNNSIVKFYYQSHRTGAWTTHFSIVNDVNDHTIVDSWDGQVKRVEDSWYGQPVEFASYATSDPIVIAPVQPAAPAPAAVAPEGPAFTTEEIPSKQIRLVKDANLWNLNDTDWSSFSTNPVRSDAAGHIESVHTIAHHKLGGSYYMPDPSQAAGYNVVDCEDYTAPPAEAPPIVVVPAPVPVTPPIPEIPAAAIPGDHIPVTVFPHDPNKYKETFVAFPQVIDYKANVNVDVKDADGLQPTQQLQSSMIVKVAATFEKDGVLYYRTEKSVQNNAWYGIPAVIDNVPTLTAVSEDALDNALDVLLHFAGDIRRDMGIFNKHEKNINAGAKLAGSIDGFLHRKK